MKKYPAWLAGALALLTAGTLLTGCSKGTGQKGSFFKRGYASKTVTFALF